MYIEIFGLDKYVVATLSRELQPAILRLTQLEPSQLYFAVHETLIFQNGVDQNAWHTIVKIQLEPSLTSKQEALVTLIKDALQTHTIHVHIEIYVQPINASMHIFQAQYPLFVTESNQVRIDQEDVDDDGPEIFHGNVFAGKEEALEKLAKDTSAPAKKKKAA